MTFYRLNSDQDN